MENLTHLAFKSEQSLGRSLDVVYDRDGQLYFLDPFILDLYKIQNSKALRRLKGKTQVISRRQSTNIRDRLVHSLEVQMLATLTGSHLGLNVPLLQAAGLGHDIGHVPFGHLGEDFLNADDKLAGKFHHARFAIFVAEMVERQGDGLNLSYETLKAIAEHSRGNGRMTTKGEVLENDVVMLCDKIAYTFSDYNDALRVGWQFPPNTDMISLGNNQTDRINSCLRAMWKESLSKGFISFKESVQAEAFTKVRAHMYEHVYFKINDDFERQELGNILGQVYDYFYDYFGNTRSACLAIALSSEADIHQLYAILNKGGSAVAKHAMHDKKNFAISETIDRIPMLATLNFTDSSKFLSESWFKRAPKVKSWQ